MISELKNRDRDYWDRGTGCPSCWYQFSGLNEQGEIGWEDCYCSGRCRLCEKVHTPICQEQQ